jgi:hypothetical protein
MECLFTCALQFFLHAPSFNHIILKVCGRQPPMDLLCHNPTLEEWEGDSLIPKMGTWESAKTSEISKFDCRGEKTSHWGVLYIIGKLSKCRCPKWARMSHLDIYNTSYDKKNGQESNWQFDSRPLKVGNWPDPGVCRWSVTHHCKSLDEGYNFASSSQSEVCRGSYAPLKLWESKLLEFRDSQVGVLR